MVVGAIVLVGAGAVGAGAVVGGAVVGGSVVAGAVAGTSADGASSTAVSLPLQAPRSNGAATNRIITAGAADLNGRDRRLRRVTSRLSHSAFECHKPHGVAAEPRFEHLALG